MKAPQSNIKAFLYTPDRFFVIPSFQRPYSWTSNNITSFLNDLEEVKNNDKKHYFGSIVYVSDGDSSIIIDGQQRATTVLLMITAIYHILQKHPEKSNIVADQVKEQFLYNKYAKQYGKEENRIKLRTVTSDNTVFEKIFDQSNLNNEAKESKLYKSYKHFYDYFIDEENLELYIETLEDFEIVTIILDKNDDNPQRVFESINSTGKPLTDGDKIRNFALMLHTQQKQDYVLNNYWRVIERTLTDVDKDYITDFFRMYLISKRQNIIKLDAVYPEFKELFGQTVDKEQSEESLDSLYSDILQSLNHYRILRLQSGDDTKFSSIKNTVFIMKYLKIDLYAPFALSVMRMYESNNINEEQLKRVFDYIRIYFSRRITCGILSTSVDRYFATLHREALNLVESENVAYDEAVAYSMLSKTGQVRLPTDIELEASIKSNTTYSQRTANINYILSAIDDESKESALLKQLASRDIRLSIEHIMPQTLTAAWREELGTESERIHITYLHGLPNLTLTGYNSEYSNLPYTKKLTMDNGFKESPLKINQTVAQHAVWNETALLTRQKWWIEKLKSVWPLPETTYEPTRNLRKIDLLGDTDLTGTTPVALVIKNDAQTYTNWGLILDAIAEYLYDTHDEFYNRVIANDILTDWFSKDSSQFRTSMELFNSGLFVCVHSNTAKKIKIINELAREFGLKKGDLFVELKGRATENENTIEDNQT